MANEITIPALPCASINETLAFYVALGFEITYQQTRPNIYGCVKRDDIDLHFFAMKGVDPKQSYSTCLVLVPDVNTIYAEFTASLRANLGKLPVAGIPRITKPNNANAAGDYRFNVVDPGGNYIRFIQQGAKSAQVEADAPDKKPLTKLGRAIQSAYLFTNAKGEFASAGNVLDKALAQDDTDRSTIEQIQALVLRAEIAINMDDNALAKKLLDDLHHLSPDDNEKGMLVDEFEKAEALRALL